MINILINKISPKIFYLLELLLKNKINIKYIYLDIYTFDNKKIDYLTNGLNNLLKDKLNSFYFKYFKFHNKCNIDCQLYIFLKNYLNKLLDLKELKIWFWLYDNYDYTLLFNEMKLCFENLKKLEKFN